MGEFRALWLAQILSVAGDQLARVALTLLVFDRTGSSTAGGGDLSRRAWSPWPLAGSPFLVSLTGCPAGES